MLKKYDLAGTQRLFTWETAILFVSALLILLPAFLRLVYIAHFSVNVPYWDEWGLVPLIDKLYAHALTPGDLFAQHNEHRIFFPLLIMLASAYLTHYNVIAELYISYALACATLVLLFIVFRRQFKGTKRALILFIPVSWMLFNFNQWENILWGFQISVYLCVFALIASLYFLDRSEKPGSGFVLSVCLAVVSSFSFVNGLMAWPAGLFLIFASKTENRWKLASGWALAGATIWAIYFYGWVKPPYHPSILYPFLHPASSILYFIAIIGETIMADLNGAIALGVTIALVSAAVLWLAAKDHAWKESGFWLSLLAFTLLSALLCVLGRSGFGVGQALSSRYITFMIPGLFGIYAISCISMKKGPQSIGRFIVFSIILVIMAIGILAGYLNGYVEGKSILEARAATIDTIKNYQAASDDALKATYPDAAAARGFIQVLEKYRLNVFS